MSRSLATASKPDKYLGGGAVDCVHPGNLVISLTYIILINTNGIYP